MAKKDFGRRLMPEYLLKYSEELQKNHPDPSASWGGGGGGGDYTAGEGIDITGDVISIDEEVVAKKTDIPTVPSVLSAFTNDVGYITGITSSDVITALGYTPGTSNFSGSYLDLTNKPTIPTKTSDLQNDSGFITDSSISNCAEIVDVTNGFPDATKTAEILANPSKYVIHGTTTNNNVTYHIFASYAGYVTTNGHTWMQVIRIPYLNHYALKPYAFCYNGSTWMGPIVYLWQISYSDIYNAPTLATVATSGSYNDLTDKPTIPTRVESPFLGVMQDSDGMALFSESGDRDDFYKVVHITNPLRVNLHALNPKFGIGLTSSYDSSYGELNVAVDTTTVALKTDIPTVPTKTSDLQNDSGFITGVTWNDVTGKPTFATVATSGSYNDLSDKPSIPSTASSTSTSTVTPTTVTLTFTYSDDTTENVTLMTGASVSTSTTTTLS